MRMTPKRVAIIGADWPEYEKYCPNFVGMQLGLTDMGIMNQLFSCRPTLNVEALIEYQPDFIVYGLLDMVKDLKSRERIRTALPDAKIVMWYGDLRNEDTGQIRAEMSEINAMFVSNAQQNSYYEDIWKVPVCHFLPLGSPVWHPEWKKKLRHNFIFVGSIQNHRGFENRAESIIRLHNEGLKLIDAPAQIAPELRKMILKNLPSLYRSAKISLDWSHFTNIPGYTSNRFWIITGSGGFALTKRFPGCDVFYPEGTRVYFDTIEEALSLHDYYLRNPDKREAIRRAGHIHAENHTYRNRFAIMFDIVYGKST